MKDYIGTILYHYYNPRFCCYRIPIKNRIKANGQMMFEFNSWAEYRVFLCDHASKHIDWNYYPLL